MGDRICRSSGAGIHCAALSYKYVAATRLGAFALSVWGKDQHKPPLPPRPKEQNSTISSVFVVRLIAESGLLCCEIIEAPRWHLNGATRRMSTQEQPKIEHR